tara:strand:+ start:258 stop:815 length:558 start_codon:yes stop_codon:yes gene_type:complete
MRQTEHTIRKIIRGIVQEVLKEDCGCEEHDCDTEHPDQSHVDWEVDQEQVQEMTATGDVAGYQTPHAFDDEDEDGHAKNIKDKAEVFDFKSTKNGKENTVRLSEGKSLFHIFRDHPDMSSRQKIGVTIREINKLLVEVEKLVRVGSRFKNEIEVESSSYWKTTNRYLMKLEDKLQRIQDKIREIK